MAEEDYLTDEREETEVPGTDPIESSEFESDEAREAREDQEEAEHEAKRAERPRPSPEGRQAPAAAAPPAAADPAASPYFATLPPYYQNAVRSGVLTVDQALTRHLANQAQHVNRIHRENEQIRADLAAAAAKQGEITAKTAARVERLLAAMGVDEPKAAGAIPSREEDEAGHVIGRLGKIEERLEAGQAELRQTAEQQRMEAEVSRRAESIERYSAADYAAVAAQAPDYDAAESFVVERVFAEEALRLAEQFPGANPQEINAQAAKNLLTLSATLQAQAAQSGISLASEVYKYAQRLGYRGQAAAAPAAPAQPSARSRDQQRMDAHRERIGASHTIAGTAPRVAPPSDGDMIRAILDFTDEEFEELFEGLTPAQQSKQMEDLLRPYARHG
jgi:hypothetical protein